MRVLVVHPGPSWATFDVYRGWIRGLTHAGCEVRPFNLDDRLRAYSSAHFLDDDDQPHRMWPSGADVARLVGHGLHAACYQFQPDVVLVISARLLPAYVYDIIRERGSKIVLLFTESPYEDHSWQLDCAPHADVCLVNDPTNLDAWRAACPTLYMPHAYDPAVHRPGPSRYDLDVAWIGTAGNTFPSRTRFLEQVDFTAAKSVFLGGLWAGIADDSPLRPHIVEGDCVDNDETAEVYRGARMSFNLYRSAGDHTDAGFAGGWAMGPREVELAATGCFYARHSPEGHGGEGDEVLPMLPRFTEPAELTEIIAHYLERDDLRRDLADQARAAVADRTFEHHAERLLAAVS